MSETTMYPLHDLLTRADVTTAGVLDLQIHVPVISDRPQRQGDVGIFPEPLRPARTPIPQAGLVVVASEASPNTHTLHNLDGQCFFDAADRGDSLGTLTVPDGASAYLVHTEEHGANAMGPGTYRLQGQYDFAGQWRRVAD